MKSVDRLREWANGLHGVYINQVDHSITVTTGWDAPPDMDSVSLRAHINGILDTIEQEVEGMRDFCERLDDAATKREDVTIWGVDYTALPLDADGEPIHIGDVIEADYGSGKVDVMQQSTRKWSVGLVKDDLFSWHDPDECHHHAPTVEDVLREFADEFNRDDTELSDGEIIERFATKLQLKEG